MGEKITGNVEMGNFTSPAAALSRCCSLCFSPHSPLSMAHGLAHQHFSLYEEVQNWIDSWILWKDENVFATGSACCPRDGSILCTLMYLVVLL
nr:hypothetical protein HmN_000436700 [Hymenolepis microstoma]